MPSIKRDGFTLVELLIVIAIIAVLTAVGVTVFSGIQKSARDSKRRADLQAIGQSLEIYKLQNGTYPPSGWLFSSSGSDPWITGLSNAYMVSVPRDPTNSGGPPYNGGSTYGYYASGYGAPDGTWFMLVAHLENGNNSDASTQCRTPDGNTFNYTNYLQITGHPGEKAFMVCNQQ